MLMAASNTLAEQSPRVLGKGPHLLPSINQIAELSKKIAFQVASVAMQQGLALQVSDEQLWQKIDDNFWYPTYRHYRRVSI